MSEIRKDPVTGRSVIIAHERTERPRDFDPDDWTRLEGGFCPFCIGHEDATPSEIATFERDDRDDEADWSVRVVPNKYPALSTDEALVEEEHSLFESTSGVGAHEVIIESPSHVVTFGNVSADQVAAVVRAWGGRLRDLRDDERLEYAMIFKNRGADAGASLEHAHSQLIAVPFLPPTIREELEGAADYHGRHDRCVFCQIGDDVFEDGERRVAQNDDVVAYAPYAPRMPFEMRIMPRAHEARFERDADDLDAAIADVLKRTLQKLDRALERPPYNLVLHTAPLADQDATDHYHWHIEIIPALSYTAGFEWGAGCHINPTPPERAAEHLRRVPLDAADA